jgi:DNA-directed RNA polymerase specialized sigma24 family protein
MPLTKADIRRIVGIGFSTDWFAQMMGNEFEDINTSIRKYAFSRGVGHLADELVGETMLWMVENKEQYDPQRGGLKTWALNRTKQLVKDWFGASKHVLVGGDKAHGVHTTRLYIFVEKPFPIGLDIEEEVLGALHHVEERGATSAGEMIEWPQALWRDLTPRERATLKVMVENDGQVSIRKLARALGMTYDNARKAKDGLLASVRHKALKALNQR